MKKIIWTSSFHDAVWKVVRPNDDNIGKLLSFHDYKLRELD